MKLSRLYSSKPDTFKAVSFSPGLNVVLAEIRLPENKAKDTHNLGKTTLGRIIDFCLLCKREPKFFLFKHKDRFAGFVFFLELELLDGSCVTIRRSVDESSKIALKRHRAKWSDFSEQPDGFWDHVDVPFEKARELLDGILDLRDLKPWDYRKIVGYLLRSQDDFREVFQLGRFVGAHSGWKPFLAHVLGFDSGAVQQHYEKEDELAKKQAEEAQVKVDLGGSLTDLSKVEGLILLKQKEAEKKAALLEQFDFGPADKERTKAVVEEVNEQIAQLNKERYYLSQNRQKIASSLDEGRVLFSPLEAEQLFAEAGIVFPGQIKKDFEQLIEFNRSITEERRTYLGEELAELEKRLKEIVERLAELGKQRSAALSFLSGTDVFLKYRRASDELVSLKADIAGLERQREYLKRLQELRGTIRTLADERTRLQARIEEDVERQNSNRQSLFSFIRLHFSEVVEEVIARQALLEVSPNKVGHLEFKAEILDDTGNATSAGLGFTYRKLLCIAFDLAVLQAHLGGRFPRFVFHDGMLESLDDRKKLNLLAVVSKYAEMGIQQIVTVIDSDVPGAGTAGEPIFAEEDVVLRLHDEDESGRLFMMETW